MTPGASLLPDLPREQIGRCPSKEFHISPGASILTVTELPRVSAAANGFKVALMTYYCRLRSRELCKTHRDFPVFNSIFYFARNSISFLNIIRDYSHFSLTFSRQPPAHRRLTATIKLTHAIFKLLPRDVAIRSCIFARMPFDHSENALPCVTITHIPVIFRKIRGSLSFPQTPEFYIFAQPYLYRRTEGRVFFHTRDHLLASFRPS